MAEEHPPSLQREDIDYSDQSQHAKRDGETMIMLGIFMLCLSIPVLLGTLFSMRWVPNGVINLLAGLALLACALGFMLRGKSILRKLNN